jgi:hypothetical protein
MEHGDHLLMGPAQDLNFNYNALHRQPLKAEIGREAIGKTSVVRLDLSSLKQIVALIADSPGYSSVNWDTPNRIRLFDLQGGQWRYNFVTQELTKE